MSTLKEDNKFDALRSRLKGLPKVNAKNDFDNRLFARIKEGELKQHAERRQLAAEPKDSKLFGWLEGLFRPSFIPAVGLTVVLLVAIVVYYGYFSGNKTPTQQTSVVNDQRQNDAGFVIYVHKDIDSPYPRNEIASLDAGDRTLIDRGLTTETSPSPMDVPSDYKTVTPKTEDLKQPEIRMDKVSEEQRIEMKRSADKDKEKETFRPEKKSDDNIELKSEKKAPSNYLRESKGEEKSDKSGKDVKTESKNSSEMNQEINPTVKDEAKKPEKKSEDSIKGGLDKDADGVLSKSAKDSTKTKKTKVDSSKTEETKDQKVIEQKDTDKK